MDEYILSQNFKDGTEEFYEYLKKCIWGDISENNICIL